MQRQRRGPRGEAFLRAVAPGTDLESMREETTWWLRTAEGDLDGARSLLEGGQFNLAAFHAQPAAEKALKSLSIHALGELRRGHSCTALVRALSDGGLSVPADVDRAPRHLDLHYAQSRYPNGFGADPTEHYDVTLARESIDQAESVVAFVRERLGDRGEGPSAP